MFNDFPDRLIVVEKLSKIIVKNCQIISRFQSNSEPYLHSQRVSRGRFCPPPRRSSRARSRLDGSRARWCCEVLVQGR